MEDTPTVLPLQSSDFDDSGRQTITEKSFRESAKETRTAIHDAEDHLDLLEDVDDDDDDAVGIFDSLRTCLSSVYDIVHSICDTNANDMGFLRIAGEYETALPAVHEELAQNPGVFTDMPGFVDAMNKISIAIDAFIQLKKDLNLLIIAKTLNFMLFNRNKRIYAMTDRKSCNEYYLAQGEHLDINVQDRELHKVKVRKNVDGKPVAFRMLFTLRPGMIDYFVCDFERVYGSVTLVYAEHRREGRAPAVLKISDMPQIAPLNAAGSV